MALGPDQFGAKEELKEGACGWQKSANGNKVSTGFCYSHTLSYS